MPSAKPANVLIERRNGSDHAWLTDFGLSKQVDSNDSLTSSAKLWAHMNQPPPSARELRPELPEELDRVIARAMAKDPADRYPSAGDLSRAAAPGGRKRSKLRVPLIAGLLAIAALGATAALVLGGGDEGEPSRPETGPLPAPSPAQVEHIDIGDRAAPSSVAAAVNTVYVLDPLQRELIAVDHGSGQVAGRVDVGRGASFVVLDELGDDRAWVASQAESSITEIDLDSGDVVRTFHVDAEPRYVEVLPDELVILTSRDDGGGLLRVDKDTGRDAGRPPSRFRPTSSRSRTRR